MALTHNTPTPAIPRVELQAPSVRHHAVLGWIAVAAGLALAVALLVSVVDSGSTARFDSHPAILESGSIVAVERAAAVSALVERGSIGAFDLDVRSDAGAQNLIDQGSITAIDRAAESGAGG